jgi:hypothetical protein
MFKRTSLILATLVLAAVPVVAHHSFAAYYLEDDLIEIEGVVIEFQYKNPHAWLFVQGQESGRAPQVFAAEWVGTSRLERDGIGKTFFREGDRLRIWASPNRNPSDNRVHLKRIERADGWKWAGRQQAR